MVIRINFPSPRRDTVQPAMPSGIMKAMAKLCLLGSGPSYDHGFRLTESMKHRFVDLGGQAGLANTPPRSKGLYQLSCLSQSCYTSPGFIVLMSWQTSRMTQHRWSLAPWGIYAGSRGQQANRTPSFLGIKEVATQDVHNKRENDRSLVPLH